MRRIKGMCAALAVLALVGCGAAGEERPTPAALVSATTAARAAAPAEEAAPKGPDGAEDLKKACRALASTRTFRTLMTATGDGGQQIETRTDAALPDRFHVSNADYELVIIGSEVYRKLPGGSWQPSPTGLAVTSLTDPKKLEEYLATSRVMLVGTEQLAGSEARVYLAAAPRSPARKSVHDDPDPFLMKIWVGSSDGLPRRLEGTVLSTKTKTSVVYYDFNAKIAVKRPTGPK
jgi:hypothetical protein